MPKYKGESGRHVSKRRTSDRPERPSYSRPVSRNITSSSSSQSARQEEQYLTRENNHVQGAATMQALPAMTKSEDWQCDKNLQDCLKYMFDTKTAADVTFRVGEDKEIVRAHKFILISRSPVFYAMFEGLLSENGEVTILDIEKNVFVDFLRYLYTDQTTLNIQNAVQIMYAAKKYCTDRLTEECRDYIKENLTMDNACDVLELTHVYADEPLASYCRQIILENPVQCMESPGFGNLCESCVSSITDSDEILTTEEVVYKAVMRWSEAECNRQNLEVTDVNRRQVLGDVIYTVRFPVMDSKFFEEEVLKHSILTSEEVLSIIRVRNLHLDSQCIKYKNTRRLPQKPKVILPINRFTISRKEIWVHDGKPDAISFNISRDVMFHGAGIYGLLSDNRGFSSGKRDIKVILELYNQTNVLLTRTEQNIDRGQLGEIFDVMLANSLKLTKNVLYTILVSVTNVSQSWCPAGFQRLDRASYITRGSNGIPTVKLDPLSVSFFNSNRSSNNTSVSCGQIPCLYISV